MTGAEAKAYLDEAEPGERLVYGDGLQGWVMACSDRASYMVGTWSGWYSGHKVGPEVFGQCEKWETLQ